MNGAQSAFFRKEEEHTHETTGGSCGTGDTSQRDDLLNKIQASKKAE